MSAAAQPIRVEVWSDVACPWCYIGKRNLDAATAAFGREHPETPVEVIYRSFELQPDAPEQYGGTISEYLAETRGLSDEQVNAMLERPRASAHEAGIEMNFEALKPAATGRAHALLHMAAGQGCQAELGEALFRANFEEGRSLGDPEVLAELAADAGLERDAALAVLDSGEFKARVEADKAKAQEYGIGGVPFFVIAERFGIAGAQPPEALLQALEQVHAERQASA